MFDHQAVQVIVVFRQQQVNILILWFVWHNSICWFVAMWCNSHLIFHSIHPHFTNQAHYIIHLFCNVSSTQVMYICISPVYHIFIMNLDPQHNKIVSACVNTLAQLPSVLPAATQAVGAEISLIVEGMAGGVCEEPGLLGYDFVCIGT